MRRHLAGRRDPGGVRRFERLHRLARGEVHQVQRLTLVCGEREVSLDHQRLGDGRIAGEAELRGDLALVHLTLVCP